MENLESVQRERRRERAREGGYRVVRLAGEGVEATFGVHSRSGFAYEVEVLSIREAAYRCSCPDFLTNTLGTCKHVEAVLLHLETEEAPRLAAARFERPREARIYLHHGEEVRVRLLRPRSLTKEGAELLDMYFDADGDFIGELWRDFGGLARSAIALGIPRIDAEVHQHVREIRERARKEAILERRRKEVLDGADLGVTRVPLHPYQRLGALHLAYRERAILADEMGLDKSAQALAAAEILRRDEGAARVLVVAPESRAAEWVRQIERLTGEAACRIAGSPDERRLLWARGAAYTVAHYEILLRDEAETTRLRPDVLVLDEAQRIRNWRTRTAEAVKRIQTRYAFVLCDTALEERLDDLYSVMQVVDQRRLGPLWRFNRRWYVLDEKGRVHGHKNQDELRGRLAPVFLRRRVREVAGELEARSEAVYRVVMPASDRAAYREAMAELGGGRPTGRAFERRLDRAGEACLGLGATPPPKLDELSEILPSLEGTVLVATSSPRMAELAGELAQAGKAESDGPGPRVRVRLDEPGGGASAEAGVLVHLDVPLDPEVRSARLKAAGEPRRVLWLVADESYEARLVADPELGARLLRGSGSQEDLAAFSGEAPEPTPPPGEPAAPPGQLRIFDPPPGDPTRAPPPRQGPTRATRPRNQTPAPPADPVGAAESLAAALRPVVGDSLLSVERLGTGLAVLVKGDLSRLRGTVRALARGLGMVPVVLDETTFEDLKPLLSVARTTSATGIQKARQELDRGRAKLAAAGALLEAGMPHEAIGPLRRCMESAARAMLLSQGDGVEDDTRLLSEVYSRLVRAGKVGAPEAGSLSRVRDLAEMVAEGGADLVDRPLARAVLQDARHLLEVASRLVGA